MPVDRSTIDEQLRAIGDNDAWWEQREFRLLPEILYPDERIQAITRGRLRTTRSPLFLPAPNWLVVATNQRLICLRQERFGRKQVELRLDQVTSIQHRSLLRGARISLQTPVQRCRIRMTSSEAIRFIGVLAPLMPRHRLEDTPAALVLGRPTAGLLDRIPFVRTMRATPPAVEFVTREEWVRVAATVDRLEKEVERLQEQVDFLENLLQNRADGVLSLHGSGSEG